MTRKAGHVGDASRDSLDRPDLQGPRDQATGDRRQDGKTAHGSTSDARASRDATASIVNTPEDRRAESVIQRQPLAQAGVT